jgi:hypothetical protein
MQPQKREASDSSSWKYPTPFRAPIPPVPVHFAPKPSILSAANDTKIQIILNNNMQNNIKCSPDDGAFKSIGTCAWQELLAWDLAKALDDPGGIEAALRRRFVLAGVLGALCFLTRPDGGLVLLLAGILALPRGFKSSFRLVLPAAVVIIPWLIFATLYYGSPLPQSVAAKQLITVAAPLDLLRGYFFLLLPIWPMQILVFLALPSGVLALMRRTESWPYSGWSVLYTGGLAFSRIEPIFPWYIVPLLPVLFIFAALSLSTLSELLHDRVPRGGRWVWTLASVLVLAGLGAWTYSFRSFYGQVRESQFARARNYLLIGRWLSQEARPGDRIMVAEVGALGYQLMNFPVIDNSGINSREVLSIRRAHWEQKRARGLRGESPDLEQDLIRTFRPEWIVTWYKFTNIDQLVLDPGFRSRYRRVFPPLAGQEEFFVLKREPAP